MKSIKFEKTDLYQEITQRLISLMEAGVNPWQKPWSGYGAPKNYASGHVYTGINSILLANTGSPVPYFMTYKQAQDLGGNIRKGAKSFGVYFYKTLLVKDGADAAGKANLKKIFYLRVSRVFNVADVEGVEFEFPEVVLQAHEQIACCEAIVAGMPSPPALVERDLNRAFYSPTEDLVNMPNLSQFSSAQAYYSTLFHELAHATGHQSRLNRESLVSQAAKGSDTYSREELVAEMCAAFLCGEAGVSRDDEQKNTAAYLSGWINMLRGDKKLITNAAGLAQKAADYIMSVNRYEVKEEAA